jgi:hypothetical protein
MFLFVSNCRCKKTREDIQRGGEEYRGQEIVQRYIVVFDANGGQIDGLSFLRDENEVGVN